MADSKHFPTRYRELIAVSTIMIALSIFFTTWRVLVRCKVSRWMAWSDWLMILGAVVSVAGMAVSIACAVKGAGRMLSDPFWQPNTVDKMVLQNRLTFASQLLNVYGMFVVKLSICAYLLPLNFSRSYRWVIWGTVVFVTIFNFILPATQHFGLCRPLASRWDTRIVDKKCWSQLVRISIAYTQAISNIITDLLYATAPIAYIRSIRLSRRTQWSVRVVFLMSLVCTVISTLKLVDFQRLQNKKEVYYESVTLSIWSMSEVTAGIVVANLPPLRKSFDDLLKHVVPSTGSNNILSRNRSLNHKFESYHLPTYHSQVNRSKGDGDSDKAILEVESDDRQHGSGIMKTTEIEVQRAKNWPLQ